MNDAQSSKAENCPHCNAERGISWGGGMSPEGWARMKAAHEAGHPNTATGADGSQSLSFRGEILPKNKAALAPVEQKPSEWIMKRAMEIQKENGLPPHMNDTTIAILDYLDSHLFNG